MSLRLLWLTCVSVGIGSSLPLASSLFGQTNADTDHYNIPVQSYAMIDISGTGTNGNLVELVALDDNNNAAFSFWDSGTTHKVGLWQNGALAANSPAVTANRLLVPNPGHTPDPNVVEGSALKNAAFDLNAKGDMATDTLALWPYGQSETTATSLSDPYTQGFGNFVIFALLDNDSMYGSGIVCDSTGFHAGWYACGKASPLTQTTSYHSDASNAQIDNCYPTSVSSIGKIAILHERFDEVTGNKLSHEVYIGDGDKASWVQVDAKNESGATPTIVSINDTKDALVVWGNGDVPPYMIQNGVVGNKKHFLVSGTDSGLIAPHPASQLRNVVPLLLSNRQTASGSGVQPVLNMIIRADERTSAKNNTWKNNVVFLLRLMSDGTTDLREVGSMDLATSLVSISALNVTDLQLNSINSSGVIAAIGNGKHALLLVPFQLIQTNYPTSKNNYDDGSSTTNSIQSGTGIDSVAYVNGTPVMPQLEAQLAGGGLNGFKIAWRFTATSDRTVRGSQDDVSIPIPPAQSITLPGNQIWKVSDYFTTPHDFFGGKCSIYYTIQDANSQSLTPEQKFDFLIRGKNPKDADAKAYITTNEGGYFYAWAIAQNETRTPSNKIYNQFATADGSSWGDLGQPFYAKVEGNGWGLFQRDPTHGGAPATTGELYSWKTNTAAAITELGVKQSLAQSYFSAIQRTYPTQYEAPPDNLTNWGRASDPATSTTLTAIQATTIALYNGATFTPSLKDGGTNRRGQPTYSRFPTCWQFYPTNASGHKWKFFPNSQDYVFKVIYNEYEGHLSSSE